MNRKLGTVVSDFEFLDKTPLVVVIDLVKLDRDDVILGHVYIEPVRHFTATLRWTKPPDFRGAFSWR